MSPTKLSEMVAQSENYVWNFVTMIFEMEHLSRLDN